MMYEYKNHVSPIKDKGIATVVGTVTYMMIFDLDMKMNEEFI